MIQHTLEREDVELVALEELFKNQSAGCLGWVNIRAEADAAGCGNEATHVVRCPCGVGSVLICDDCLAWVSQTTRRFMVKSSKLVWFRERCNHTVDFAKCTVMPV